MRHLDLFSGIGGFALAAKWMGWGTIQFVEIDKFCQKVLNKNFPNVPIHGDIKTFDGSNYRGTVDILTGGFPCQPFSSAGQRKGTEDDRHLWPQMLRVIGEVQPAFIVGENVYGLVNWSNGLVFEQVQTSLENKGYEVAPVILPACAINAPHRRDRIWFVAHTKGYGMESGCKRSGGICEQDNIKRIPKLPSVSGKNDKAKGYCRGQWDIEPQLGRVADGIPNRVDRIKSLGNAIVPQVAFEIFKAIESTR